VHCLGGLIVDITAKFTDKTPSPSSNCMENHTLYNNFVSLQYSKADELNSTS